MYNAFYPSIFVRGCKKTLYAIKCKKKNKMDSKRTKRFSKQDSLENGSKLGKRDTSRY